MPASEKLRIISIDGGYWRVQRKWLGLLWVNIYVNTGPDYWETVDFATTSESQAWIDNYHRREREYAIAHGDLPALPDAFITSTSDNPNYYVTIKTKTLADAQQWHEAVLGLAGGQP